MKVTFNTAATYTKVCDLRLIWLQKGTNILDKCYGVA